MEKKSKKAKEVSMAPETKEPEKIPYDQLEAIANNLNYQCKQLSSKLQEAQEIIASFNDVAMLLSIIDKAEYFDDDFSKMCIDKIQEEVTRLLTEKPEEKKAN